MFDVSWSDPTSETVGQRRSRKEHDQNTAKATPTAPATSTPTSTSGLQRRASTSSDSVTTKHRPSLLTLLNSSRKDFSRPASRAKIAELEGEPAKEPARSRAGGVGDDIPPIPELPPGTLTSDVVRDRCVVTEFRGGRDRDKYSPSDEPAFTSWASRSASTDSTWSSIADSPRKSNFVQPLSPTSFVTQRTEITVASREDVDNNEQHLTIVHISADGKGPSLTHDFPPQLSPSSTSELRMPEFYSSEKSASTSRSEDVNPQPYDKQTISSVTKMNLWKAPENWECVSTPVPPPKSSARPPWRPGSDENGPPGSNVFQLQKSLLRRMRTASPKIMLERLTEDWTDPDDATINEELEFEKQLWMRTALHACLQATMIEGSRGLRTAPKPVPALSEAVKILSLYEDHASLSYLSALTTNPSPTSEIHHLSTNPLPSANIYSLTVPSPKPHLPYAPHLFTTISASLALPALLPSPAIPTLLKECHRVLRQRGTLRLTLIDPCPVAATTGPKLRAWLDAHLLLELERKFRCTNPCRLVPGWCADAGFEGAPAEGVARMRFAASTETGLAGSHHSRFGGREAGAAAETREELRAVVGRMLWEECWGAFCVGGEGGVARRWWEDGEVMKECIGMGTTWEVLVVEAEKEG